MIDLSSPGWNHEVKSVLDKAYFNPDDFCGSPRQGRFGRFIIGRKHWTLIPEKQLTQVTVDPDGKTIVRKLNDHSVKKPDGDYEVKLEPISDIKLGHYSDLTLDILLGYYPLPDEEVERLRSHAARVAQRKADILDSR